MRTMWAKWCLSGAFSKSGLERGRTRLAAALLAVDVMLFAALVLLARWNMSFFNPITRAVLHGRTAIGRRVRMYVCVPINPGAIPRTIVDDDRVCSPSQGRPPPTPRCKTRPNHDPGAKRDRSAHVEARTRARINNQWIVARYYHISGNCGQNLDVRPIVDADIGIAPEISVIIRAPPHALDGVHHLTALRKNRVPKFLRPAHIARH